MHETVTVEMPGTMRMFAVHHYHGKETEDPFMYTIPRVLKCIFKF